MNTMMMMIIQIHLKTTVFLQVMVIINVYISLTLIYIYFTNVSAIYLINHKPKFETDQDLTDAKVNSCLQRVTEILGFELAKDVITEHLINNEFNIEKTIDQILNSKSGKLNKLFSIFKLKIL